MGDYILGIPLNSESFRALGDRFESYRRNILHFYPNGKATLTGILSLIGEESVNDALFHWFEDRYELPKTSCRRGDASAALTTTEPGSSTADGANPVTNGTGAVSTATALYLTVNGTQFLRPGYIISVGNPDVQLYVAAVTNHSTITTNGYVKCYLLRAGTFSAAAGTFKAADFASGETIQVLGVAIGEGAAGAGINPLPFKRPPQLTNQTQISRTAMSFTGSALKMGLKYDNSGPYLEESKKKEIEHMTALERNLIFGKRSTTMRSALDGSSNDEVVRTTSGILEFLELWDAGSTGLQIDGATYAPYSGHSAATTDGDDNKRIIENASGTMSVDKLNEYFERVSRFHSPMTDERLVLCGSKAIQTMTTLFRKETEYSVDYNNEKYGLRFTTFSSPFGAFHFMQHPMFNMRNDWRSQMLILDVHSIKYRALIDRDTQLLKNRQNPGDDFRKDEFLTEAGVEFWQPEANMLIKNVNTYEA